MYAYAWLLEPSRPRRNSHGPCMQWPRSIQAIQAKANIPMLTRLLFFPSLHVSFLFPKHHISLPSFLARHKGRAGKCQRGQPVREAVSYRGLFSAGWFGVREKHCFWLEIYDRLRASEQALCLSLATTGGNIGCYHYLPRGIYILLAHTIQFLLPSIYEPIVH